ncbi:cupin domain-containing protein [Patulibacter sp. SYSU D01012]|uniref:cupin domain-containing protein n=1 Tax=Patulibacter sp. SYSU D01012 TaxID=2817381 RepID=UPI001B30E108|nr:cupin domain-containing protein [Patulibacter sp. SYSU D01012]
MSTPTDGPALVANPDLLTLELKTAHELDDVREGEPQAFYTELYSDDVAETGVWEVTPGEFAGDKFGASEVMLVLKGEATITSEDGTTIELRPGVSFVTPDGWRGRWKVRETVRKMYVIWKHAA